MESKHYTVQIIGGGLAGLGLATALARNNIAVLIIDAMPRLDADHKVDLRTSALMPTSVNFLKNIHAWHPKSLEATPIEKIKIIQIIPPKVCGRQVCFSSNTKEEPLAYNISNHALRVQMYRKIHMDRHVVHLFDSKVKAMQYSSKGWKVFTKNSTYTADITIGADGYNAFSRQQVGIDARCKEYGQTAIVCTINHTLSNKWTSVEFLYPEGVCTFVPMGQNKSAVVWIESSENAKTYVKDKNLALQVLQKKSQQLFGNLTSISNIEGFALRSVMARRATDRRFCLIGEAYHAMPPHGAQGLNLSLRDSATLSELILSAHRRGEDVGSQNILNRYAKRRTLDVKARTVGNRIFHLLSQSSSPFSNICKTLTMAAIEAMPMAKTALMKAIATPAGYMPTYLRSEDAKNTRM